MWPSSGRIRGMRRLAALLFAVLLPATPLAASLCQSVCAMQDAMAATPAHGCHEVEAPEGPVFNGIPHACGHDGASLPDAVSPVLLVLTAPAILPSVNVDLAPVRVAREVDTEIEHSPPGLLATRSTQLRL